MTHSAFDITPTARKWVGSFPAPLAGRLRSDRTAHARRVQEILQCLGGGAGGGSFAARGMRAASSFDPRKISGCVFDLDFTDPGSQTIVTASIVDGSNFSTGNWYQGNTTIASDFAVAPDSTTTADKVTATASAAATVLEQVQANGSASAAGNPLVTAVIYAKYVSCQWIVCQACTSAAPSHQVFFDIQNGVMGAAGSLTAGSSIVSVGNGWYRCTWQLIATSTTPAFRLDFSTTNTTATLVSAGAAVLLWGASISQPRVSSILNRVSGAPVVQAAAYQQPGLLLNGINGRPVGTFFGTQNGLVTTEAAALASFQSSLPQTLFGVVTPLTASGASVWISAGNGTNVNPYRMAMRNSDKDAFEARPDSGADVLVNGTAGFQVASTNYVKEITYSGSAVAAWSNGAVSIPSTAFATGTTTMTRVVVGAWGAISLSNHNGLMGRVTVFSRALSAAERSYARVGFGDQFAITVAP